MKTLIKILILIPLLSLGGCYTQLALRDSGDRDYEDEYVYQEEADSLGEETYYDDDFPINRRYYWGYHPSVEFYFGIGRYYDPFWWDWYCCTPGYYWPWSYYSPWYNYSRYNYWSYYNPWYYNYGNNFYYQSTYKYRNVYTRLRDNDGGRGTAGTIRDLRGSGTRSSIYTTRDRDNRGTDVDLSRTSVSRNRDNSKGNSTLSKNSPKTNETNRTSGREVRTRDSGNRQDRNPAPSTKERDSSRGNNERGKRSEQPTSVNRGSENSGRNERPAPSYTPPREEPRSSPPPSYNPPPRSSSEGNSSRSGSSSGSSSRSGNAERSRG